jgi:hypothetical protein
MKFKVSVHILMSAELLVWWRRNDLFHIFGQSGKIPYFICKKMNGLYP